MPSDSLEGMTSVLYVSERDVSLPSLVACSAEVGTKAVPLSHVETWRLCDVGS